MYNRHMYRKTFLTRTHSYKILLSDIRNLTFIQQPCKPDPRIQNYYHVPDTPHVYCSYSETNVRNLTLSRKKETFYHRRYAYNNRVENGFTSAIDIKWVLSKASVDVYSRLFTLSVLHVVCKCKHVSF